MKQWVYDIETYKNFFCITFLDYSSDEKHVFEISSFKNERMEMKEFMRKRAVLIGYNSLLFDNPIVNYVLAFERRPDEIFDAAQLLIHGQKDSANENAKKEYNKFIKKYKHSDAYISIDLMLLHAAKKLRVSLKEMEVSMKWPLVQDLPYPFDSHLTREQMDNVIKYNLNDCGATKELCNRLKEDINLRIQIEEEYGIKCLSKDGVRTGVDLFASLYEKKVGNRDFLNGRSFRDKIHLGDVISDVVTFNSSRFNELLEMFKNKTIIETKGSLDYSVIYGGVKHDYGTGGIHSKDAPGILMPRKGEIYKDADVNSLYPSLIIEYGFSPEHLDADVFLPLYKGIRDERLEAKSRIKTDPKAKLLSDTYKLALNGTYGNMISEYSWLYDPKAAMGVTLNGQLMLSMLSERFTDAGFRVDSLNTDGITCFIPKEREEEYNKIASDWEQETRLGLEFAYYHKMIRTAGNHYLAWYADGEGKPLYKKDGEPYVKEKGFFLRDISLGKGYDKPIIPIALWDYYIKGIPVEQSIKNHKDIYDFCMMQKMGSKFSAVWNGEKQQKTNRFYASKGINSGYLYKQDGSKRSHVLKDSGITIFNQYEEKEMIEYGINYDFYIREARKIQRDIESNQTTLF